MVVRRYFVESDIINFNNDGKVVTYDFVYDQDTKELKDEVIVNRLYNNKGLNTVSEIKQPKMVIIPDLLSIYRVLRDRFEHIYSIEEAAILSEKYTKEILNNLVDNYGSQTSGVLNVRIISLMNYMIMNCKVLGIIKDSFEYVRKNFSTEENLDDVYLQKVLKICKELYIVLLDSIS